MSGGMKSVACLGDTTTAGGRVLEGEDRLKVDGVPATYEGAQVLCGMHGLTHIAEATMRMTVNGRRIARDGDQLACGHHLVILEKRRLSGTSVAEDDASTCKRGTSASLDTNHEVEVRLLRRSGQTHDGLDYVKAIGEASGQRLITSVGRTVARTCTAEDTVRFAFAVPDMETR